MEKQIAEDDKLSAEALSALQKLLDQQNQTLATLNEQKLTSTKSEVALRQEQTSSQQNTPLNSGEFAKFLELIQLNKELNKEEEEQENIPVETHPALIASRAQGQQLIEKLLEKTKELSKQFDPDPEEPACAYQGMLQKYLGKNFVVPSIHDLAFPDPRKFELSKVPERIMTVSNKLHEDNITKLQMLSSFSMSAQEMSLSAANLNHAFSVLSATPEGPQYIIDNERTAKYLLFAETVRTMPVDYVKENPLTVAYKLLFEWCNIFEPMLLSQSKD